MLPEFSEQEIDCDNVLECIYNLSDLDREVLSVLSEDEEYRSSEIAEKIDKDQSTAYRSLEKLLDCGLVYKEKKNIRNGGYYYLYSKRPLENIKEEAKTCVDQWYEEIMEAIQEMDDI